MEVEKLNSPKGLKNTDDILKLCRLMVRAEDNHTRETLLNILQVSSYSEKKKNFVIENFY